MNTYFRLVMQCCCKRLKVNNFEILSRDTLLFLSTVQNSVLKLLKQKKQNGKQCCPNSIT